MADNEAQADVMNYVYNALREWFKDLDDVFVGMDMLVYYVEGDPRSVVAPDNFVVFGARKGRRSRMNWMIWKDGDGVPNFALEVASRTTYRNDAGRKRDIYARMGVREYWRIDVLGFLPIPTLVGERLVDGEYEPIEIVVSDNGEFRGYSEELGLELRATPGNIPHDYEDREPAPEEYPGDLRLYDPVGRVELLSYYEVQDGLRQEEERRREAEDAARRETQRREEAEAEIRRLRETLARIESGG